MTISKEAREALGKLRAEFDASAERCEKNGLMAACSAYTVCAEDLKDLLSTFTEQQEGVRLEGFKPVFFLNGRGDWLMELTDSEHDRLSQVDRLFGTLIFIPEVQP